MRGLSKAIEKATKDITRAGGKVAREKLLEQAKLAAGSDRKFSNFKGPALGVKVRQEKDAALVLPVGPWKIAEVGAAPHGGHPGTAAKQGKRRWSKGRDEAFDQLKRDVPRETEKTIRRGFNG